jgi:hypothetical protein
MPQYAVDASIDDRVLPCFLMLHHRRREGVLPEGERDDSPASDEQEQPEGGNHRRGASHQVQAEHIQRNEEDQADERGENEKRGHNDLVRKWLALLTLNEWEASSVRRCVFLEPAG